MQTRELDRAMVRGSRCLGGIRVKVFRMFKIRWKIR